MRTFNYTSPKDKKWDNEIIAYSIIGKFAKAQLVELCPSLSVKSIESSLKRLVDENMIEKHGAGKNTYYTKK